MPLTVRPIAAAEHRAYVATHPAVPLQQTPGWGRGFESARTESLGWFDAGTMVGAGLVRYRGLPRIPLRTVAVFESGPDIDWTGQRRPGRSLSDWTDPLVDYLRDQGVFSVRVNPAVSAQEWWAVDPAEPSTSKELVLRVDEPVRWDHERAAARLDTAGWSPMELLPPEFAAEVVVAAGVTRRRLSDLSGQGSLLAGFTVRTGAPEELELVHRAISGLHRGIPLPGVGELRRRWEGLASDDPGGVKLLVVEQRGDIVYGGLVAVAGDKAWDLSVAVPQPDADRPEVQVLRTHLLAHAAMTGSRALAVPTVVRDRRSPVRPPAPGWPPARLRRLIGTWQFPVRATWYAALAPIVDRIVL